MTTVAEDLVLLLLDLQNGRPIVDRVSLDRAIGGALLLDLSVRGRVSADGDGARAKLAVVEGKPIGDALLDDALSRVGSGAVRAQRAVERLSRRTREPVFERLVARGVIARSSGRMLGLFPVTTWTVLDPAPREALRAQLAQALLKGVEPDQHIACLVSLLHAVKAEHKVVEGTRRELRARAEEIADGDWAGAAVRRAVQSVQIAVAAAASAGAASGASGS
ncbi:GOLPH3/VPS74 family protein [Pseudonocardia sp. GCM10023141]|uniref:GOLPH3/VPS74 family protein n=1 Tax=Pseudonocardia sp. GCM10023141 TaxID=3252653 RepID=UPI003607622F